MSDKLHYSKTVELKKISILTQLLFPGSNRDSNNNNSITDLPFLLGIKFKLVEL